MATTKANELGQFGSKLTVHNENITLDGTVHGQYAGFDSDINASSIGDLSNVDITTSAPSNNQSLIWDNANSKFVPGDSFSQSDFNTAFGNKSTSDLSEGTNEYHTTARARGAISATGSLSYNSTSGVMSFTQGNTDTISEGSSNLYYTDARADARVALVVDAAPSTLNTLNELAAALGDDANFSTTVTNSIATKLPLAGGTMTGNLSFGDNTKAIFGAGSDLEIYHDGNHSIIKDAGVGYLKIGLSNAGTAIQNAAGTNLLVTDAYAVSLRYNGGQKLNTASTGVAVTGNATFRDNDKAIFGAGSDLQMYHDGFNSYIDDAGQGVLAIRSNSVRLQKYTGEEMVQADADGAVILYHNNVVKFATTATGIDVTGNIAVSGTVDGRDVATDGSKLDGIETNATADQTGAQIKVAYEAESDTNAFTDADHSKLDGIESGATGDQTNAEIRAAVEAATDSNVFTDADHTKLNAIEASATADQTAAEIKALVGSATDSNVFTDADHTKLDGIETAATADQTKSDIEGLGIDVPATNLTGTIPAARLSTATTQAESDDSTKIATTAYVVDKITTLIGGAPSTLNDLNELAAAINDDANYNTTLTTALATKLPLAGGTMTGNLNISIPDNGGAPANTAILGIRGYEGRGAGITIRDQANSASGSSNREWFVGSGYNQSAFNIGYSSTATQTSYSAQNKLTILTSGNVGIGTTSPGHKLDVEGGNNAFDIARFGSSASDNSEVTIGYFDANANNGIPALIGSSDFGGLIQGGQNGHLVLGIRDNDSTDALDIVSGGGNFMTNTTYDTLVATFKSNGNVGIGTSSPGEKLDVNGVIRSLGNNNANYSTSLVGRYDSTHPMALYVRGNSATNSEILGVYADSGGANLRTAINPSNGWKVGIGTSSPDTNLHVFKASAGTITNYTNNALVVENSGDVGISLLTPNSGAGHLMFGSPGHQYHSYIRGQYGGSTTSTLRFFTDNINTMTHKAGNVGIGTDSPNANLDIEGSGAQVLSIYSTDTGSQQVAKTFINLYGENTASEKKLQAQIASSPGHNASNAGEMHFSTNNSSSVLTRRMTIRENGAVGIDDNNPSEKLSIGGGSIKIQDVGQYIYFGTNSSVKIGTVSGNSNDLYLGSADDINMESNYIRFWRDGYYGSTEYGRLAFAADSWLCTGSSSHYLGIGITNPTERLHVSGNILATGNVTANSDISLKDNITPIPDALDKVLQIRGVTFNRNDIEDNPRHAGVIAQEVEKVLPEVVSEGKDGIKSVAYGNMVGLLVEAIKEQQEQINMLKEKLESK